MFDLKIVHQKSENLHLLEVKKECHNQRNRNNGREGGGNIIERLKAMVHWTLSAV